MNLPDSLGYGLVKWTAVSAVADGPFDSDSLPDARPVTGRVTFTPSAPILLALSDPPVTVISTPVTYDLDDEGVLRDRHGNEGVMLLATNSSGVTPIDWTWTVTYSLNDKLSRGSFSFRLPADSVVDLTRETPIASSRGVSIVKGDKGESGLGFSVIDNADGTFTLNGAMISTDSDGTFMITT